jgi:hypothetical protein
MFWFFFRANRISYQVRGAGKITVAYLNIYAPRKGSFFKIRLISNKFRVGQMN